MSLYTLVLTAVHVRVGLKRALVDLVRSPSNSNVKVALYSYWISIGGSLGKYGVFSMPFWHHDRHESSLTSGWSAAQTEEQRPTG